MKTKRNVEAPYTEKINRHVPSGWYIRNMFVYGYLLNSLKIYHCIDCADKFVEPIKYGVKQL